MTSGTALDNAEHTGDVESIKLLQAALDKKKKGNEEDSSLTIATDVVTVDIVEGRKNSGCNNNGRK